LEVLEIGFKLSRLYRWELAPLGAFLVSFLLGLSQGFPPIVSALLGVAGGTYLAVKWWNPAAWAIHQEARTMQRALDAWALHAEHLGLAPIRDGKADPPRIIKADKLPGGFRLTFALPAGVTPTMFEQKAEAIAGAFRGSSAQVHRQRRADRVRLTVVGKNDPLFLAPPAPTPFLELEAGRDPSSPLPVGFASSGELVTVELAERSFLIGGSPGSGKSVAVQQIVAGAALSKHTELWLIDPKGGVELLSFWEACATRSETSDRTAVMEMLTELQEVMDARYVRLREQGLRRITPSAETPLIVLVIDELAFFTAATGKLKTEAADFSTALLDLVARGRAAGVVPVLVTQKPSAQVVPTAIRDLCSTRFAFRCGNNAQSDTILGDKMALAGYDASTIATDSQGLGLLLGETGKEAQRFRSFWLQDDHLRDLAKRAEEFRLGAREPRPKTLGPTLLAEAIEHPQRSDLPTESADAGRALFEPMPPRMVAAADAWTETTGHPATEWPPIPPRVVFGCSKHVGQVGRKAILAAMSCPACNSPYDPPTEEPGHGRR
jgi:S-DNA-T family DNA segregation ATPase FtsK/SpoIIIE